MNFSERMSENCLNASLPSVFICRISLILKIVMFLSLFLPDAAFINNPTVLKSFVFVSCGPASTDSSCCLHAFYALTCRTKPSSYFEVDACGMYLPLLSELHVVLCELDPCRYWQAYH